MRGFSLGTIIILGMLCMVLAFVVASLCTFQLNAATQAQNREEALHLAEGALALTVSHIHDGLANNSPYGLNNERVTFQPDPSDSARVGQVTFDTTNAWGWSTPNYDGKHGSGWHNAKVPQSTVHIVSLGTVGHATHLIEALIAVPQFQYVLAVDGPLQSSAPLEVKAEASMQALVSDPLLNSNLGANVGSNTSVTAASNSYVSGDVVCAGAVSLNAPSTVLGAVRNGTITTPDIPITKFSNNAPGTPTMSGTVAGPVLMQVGTYAPGPLTINGDLTLSNATLYVEGGPLIVNGALKGTGAVFVNGSVQISGGADLDASNMVALLASGDVALTGTPGLQKYFQGLVYTDGNFSASDITIAGAFVAHDPSAKSSLTLGANTQVVYVPTATSLPAVTVSGAPVALSAVQPMDAVVFSPTGVLQSYFDGPPPAGVAWTPDDATSTAPSASSIYAALIAAMGSNPDFQNWLMWNSQSGPAVSLGNVELYNNNGFQVSVHAMQFNPVTQRFDLINPPQIYFGTGQDGLTPTTQAAFDAAAQSQGTSSAKLIPLMIQSQQIYANLANQLLTGSPGTTTTGSTVVVPALDLNNYFLSDQDPIRIVMWREH